MTCSNFLARFSDLRDDLVSPAERALLEAHMEECPRCARYSRVVSEGISLVRDLPGPALPADFEGRLRHSLYTFDESERRRRFRPHAPNGGGAMTVVAAAALLAAVIWTPTLFEIDPTVDLPEIVVKSPPPEAAPSGIAARSFPPGSVTVERTRLSDRDLWSGSNVLLFEYTPLYRSPGASFTRTGIQ